MPHELEMNTNPDTRSSADTLVNRRHESSYPRQRSSWREDQHWEHATSFGMNLRHPAHTSHSTSKLGRSNRNWLYAWTVLATFLVLPRWASPAVANAGLGVMGAQARTIPLDDREKRNVKREDSPTDVCSRWSHQSTVVNGTLYLYGGRSTQAAGQKENTWNNDFLSVSLSESWDISSPKLQGLPRPSGPPSVSNAYLWHSYDALYLYGGEYSDSPFEEFDPFSLWEYDIKTSSWREHADPKTSAGNNSVDGNQPIQRVAEGAGVTVADLGRGWYFGGHYDHYTTPGWSLQTPRLYLKSLIEYTFPAYGNDGVESLSGGKSAGKDGIWRNITEGGIQNSNAFPQRADGVLVHVPGFGESGILLSLAGGNNETFVGGSNATWIEPLSLLTLSHIVPVERDRRVRYCYLNMVQAGNGRQVSGTARQPLCGGRFRTGRFEHQCLSLRRSKSPSLRKPDTVR